MEKIDYQYLGELLERAQQGDRDAFDTLYKKTYKRQYLVACSFLNDEFLAEDALQEIYLSVF
ncbi:MAG: RNA polymerase subunit sigma, partial [Eubacterium sp.]